MEYYDKAIASKICCIFIKICYNIGKYIILFLRPSGCMIFYFYRGCFSAGYRVIPDM